MHYKPVTSSSIDAVGYDPETSTLHVQFASGRTYEYANVDPDTHQELIGAESVGKHFSTHIRPNFKGVEA